MVVARSSKWRGLIVLALPIVTIPGPVLLSIVFRDQVASGDISGGYPGTVLLVSHDRALLDAVAERTVAIEDRTLRSYDGGWADLVLPAAGWGEKDGTFINSERRVGLVKRVAPAPGAARLSRPGANPAPRRATLTS